MNNAPVKTVGAVEVDGCLVGYLYLVEKVEPMPGPCWRYVENRSGASYSHMDMVVLLGLIKSSLRIPRWAQLEVIPIGEDR